MSLTINSTIEDAPLANNAAKKVSRFLASNDRPYVELRLSNGKKFEVPEIAVQALQNVLACMSQGRTLTIYPEDAELTTQKAADLLNVSRPYLIQLLEDGTIPFRKVGTHRRIRYADLHAYRLTFEERRQTALQELAEETDKLGLGY